MASGRPQWHHHHILPDVNLQSHDRYHFGALLHVMLQPLLLQLSPLLLLMMLLLQVLLLRTPVLLMLQMLLLMLLLQAALLPQTAEHASTLSAAQSMRKMGDLTLAI